MNYEKWLLCKYSVVSGSVTPNSLWLWTAPLQTPRLLCLRDSPGNKTRVVTTPILGDKYSTAVHKQKLISEAFENKGKNIQVLSSDIP